MDLVTSCKEKLTHFRIKELKDILTQLGLSKQGKKQDLADRILAILSDDRVSAMWAKKCVRKEDVAKLVDDMYRKLQVPGATELASKGQGVSDITINNNHNNNNKTTFKEEAEDSYQSEKVRCPCGSSLQADSMIKCEERRCNVWQHIACVIIPEKTMEGILPPHPSVFYCEICRLGRADPFWVTMGHPLPPVKLTIANIPIDGSNPVQSVEKTFHLSKADRELLSKPEFELQAWCMLLNDKVSFRMQWPQYADLQINGMPVRAINRPGSQLLGANGRDDGPIITPCTRDGNNKISLTGCDARVFCLGVRIMRRRTVQQILNMIPKESDGERFEDAVARVCRCVGGGAPTENADSDSDLEVVSDSIPVNLRCPMSGSRMKIAGRFKPCVHMGCFDLDVFVQMNQRSRKWQCPICLKNYSLESVIIDPYFTRITTKMRNLGEDVTEIEVKPDGCWRVKPDNNIKNLGELGEWHKPDGSLLSTPMEIESKPKQEPLKQVKQEVGISECGNTTTGPTKSLKLGIKKNQNGKWEVSRPEKNLNSLSSGNKQPEQNLFNNNGHNFPLSSSATMTNNNNRNSEDPSINQSGGGHFGHSTSSRPLSPNYNFNPPDADIIVLSDSDDETQTENLMVPDPVVTVPTHTPNPNIDSISNGNVNSTLGGSGSCLGLFNSNEDDFGVPFWSLPSSSQVGPSFQLFGSDENQVEDDVMMPESSIYQCDGGLVDNPLAYGHDDPSLQLFLPTGPSEMMQGEDFLRDEPLPPPPVSNGFHGDDWISLSLGGGGGGGGGVGGGGGGGGGVDCGLAATNGVNSGQQLLPGDGALDPLSDTGSLLTGMNGSKKSRERCDNPFSFPKQKRSVRPRFHLSLETDSEEEEER